jgi:uncharacterized protein YkwD
MTSQLRTLARRFGIAAILPLLMGPALIASSPSAEAAYRPSAATVAAYEARVIVRINQQRVKYKRIRLAPATCPDGYAEGRATYLAKTGKFYHRSMTSFLNGCHASQVAENLARGNRLGATPDKVVAMWMRSPGHRANILNGRLTRIGVGAVYARGQWTVVADFSRP